MHRRAKRQWPTAAFVAMERDHKGGQYGYVGLYDAGGRAPVFTCLAREPRPRSV